MSDSHLSRPLCELAEELAGLISQLCELMIRKWTQSELKKGTPMVEFYRAISPDRLSRLEMPSLRLVAWAEQHKPAKERRQFQERYTSFCKLTMHFGTLVNPSTYLFSGLHVSPPQTSVVLLDDRHLMQAKLAGSHLPETLRAWALEMRQQAAKAQEPTEEAAGDPVETPQSQELQAGATPKPADGGDDRSPDGPKEDEYDDRSPDGPKEDEYDGRSLGGPKEDEYDDRVAWWMGKRIYLGSNTQISRLFWLLANPVGRAHLFSEVQRAVDQMEANTDTGSTPEDVEKSRKRICKAVSKLKAAMREAGLDDHFLIHHASGEYSMIPRYGPYGEKKTRFPTKGSGVPRGR